MFKTKLLKYTLLSLTTITLICGSCFGVYADDFVTYEFKNNSCYIEGTKYATLKTENQCYYGALSISDRQNDMAFWQSWLREFNNQTQTSFSALAQQIYDVITTGKADNLFLDSLKQAYKNDNDRNFAYVQTYLTDLLNNGSNKNYYTSPNYNTYKNYSITNTINKYDTVNNQYYQSIDNISYTYNNTNYNYEINNYTYNTYKNEYTFNTSNNYSFTYINNFNNTTIIDNSGTQNLYYKLPDGSNSLNLTQEEALNGYKTSLSVASYSNTYDSEDLEFLYHFDNNEYNAAYPKPVNLSISPNSVEFISSGNFNQALVLSENVNLSIDKSSLFYSFRLNPRIQDKFKLTINGTEIASRISQIETTYDFVEWTQTSNTVSSNLKNSFTISYQDKSYNNYCTGINGFSWTLLSRVLDKNTNLYTYSCVYQQTYSTSSTTSTNQRTYNIINNKLYLDEGTRYLNYNQWNYISILLDGSVYINGIDTHIDIDNTKNFLIKIEQDGISYIDELAGFNIDRSTFSPSIPYDTNLAYILPSIYMEKVEHANGNIHFIPETTGEYGYLLSDFQVKYLTDHKDLFDTSKYTLYFNRNNNRVFVYSYIDNIYYMDYLEIFPNTVSDINSRPDSDTSFFNGTNAWALSAGIFISCSNLNLNGSTFGLPKTSYSYTYTYDYVPTINNEIINNQLTIKSNIYVKDWKFGGIRPSSPDTGYVYVYVDDLGYIKSVQQFNGIEWLEVQASLFNYYEQKWLSAYDFNIFMNDWKSISSKYQTDNSLFNTLFSFLSDKFDSVVNAIKGISNENNNNYINNVQNTYNINYQNDTNKLINNLKNADNNVNLQDPSFNIGSDIKLQLNSLNDTVDTFVSGLNDTGIGFMILAPIILGLVGLMF